MLSSLLLFFFALTLAEPELENSVGLLKGEVVDQVQPENEFQKAILAALKGEKDGQHPVLDRLAKKFYEQNKAALGDPAKMRQLIAKIKADKPEKKLKEFMASKGITDEKEGIEAFLDEKEEEMEKDKLDGKSVPPHFFHLKKEEKKKPMLGGKKGRPPPKKPGLGKGAATEEVAVGLMVGEIEDKIENENEFQKTIFKMLAKEKDGMHPILDKLAHSFYKDNEEALKDPAKMKQLIAKISAEKPEKKLKEFMASKGITDEKEGIEAFLDAKEKEMEADGSDGKSVPPNFFHLKKEEKKKPMLGGEKGRPPTPPKGKGKPMLGGKKGRPPMKPKNELFYTQSSSSGVEDFLTYVFAAFGVAFLAKHAFQFLKQGNYTPL